MTDLNKISTNLEISEEGIWLSKSRSEVSYPAQGNQLCSMIEDDSYWFRHRNDCITRAVKAFPPTGPLFDIGGGNGFVALALQVAGFDVALVEPGIVGARNAKRRGIHTVVCSTLENAAFQENSLPAVGLFDVIEHIDDDESFLHAVRKLLIPKGRVYITAPAYNALWSTEDDSAGHFRRYTLSDINRTLTAAGFTTVYSTYFFSLFVVPIFLLRSLPSRFSLRKAVNAAQTKNEHSLPSGLAGRVLNGMFQKEISLIREGKQIPFGGSCLVVAEAP